MCHELNLGTTSAYSSPIFKGGSKGLKRLTRPRSHSSWMAEPSFDASLGYTLMPPSINIQVLRYLQDVFSISYGLRLHQGSWGALMNYSLGLAPGKLTLQSLLTAQVLWERWSAPVGMKHHCGPFEGHGRK